MKRWLPQNPFAKSLRLRLTFSMLLAISVPLLGSILLGSYFASQILRQNAEQDLQLRANALQDSVLKWEQVTTFALQNLSRQPDIISMDSKQQKPVLVEMSKVYTNMYLVATTDLKGMNVARSDTATMTNYSDRPWFAGALKGNDLTRQVLLSRTSGKPAVCFSAPIRESTKIVGVAMTCTELATLAETVGAIRLGQTGYAFLVDDKGQVLAHPDATMVTGDKLKNLSLYPPVQSVLQRQSDLFSFTDEAGRRWLSYTVPLDNGWGVIIQQESAEVLAQVTTFWQFAISILAVVLVVVSLITLWITKRLARPIADLTVAASALTNGQLDQPVIVTNQDEIGILGHAFNTMAKQLREFIVNLEHRVEERTAELTHAKEAAEAIKDEAERAKREAEIEKEKAESFSQVMEKQVWLSTGQAQLSEKIHGEQDMAVLANSIIQQLCKYLNAHIGAMYVLDDELLKLMGSYAYSRRKNLSNQFKIGEGLVGQAALEKQAITISNVPTDYIAISSGLGETAPRHILVSPFLFEQQLLGVVEIGTLTDFTPLQLEFVEKAMENIAIAFNTALARHRIDELLAESRQQAEELSAQGSALRVANEELETQTEHLRASEAKLKEQQAELESTNVELEEKATALQESTVALEEKQVAIDKQNQELQRKAEDLALASKYKSEFLANMSHELRTPLNSLLILARMLASNDEGNLTTDQVESAQIIFSGGTDLLNLINEILDLAKVESGKMTFSFEPMPFNDLINTVKLQFTHVAEQKGLALNISIVDDLPAAIVTDQQRVKQIVKNLLSNSFKFTDKGSINLDIYRPSANPDLAKIGLDAGKAVAISVTDTGIGMTADQQKIVFEAFQQADGSTSRQYGGTGLGLSISRELALKMGGSIGLTSEPGQGSTFILYLPLEGTASGNQESGSKSQKSGKSVLPSRPKTTQFVPPEIQNSKIENPEIQKSKILKSKIFVPDDRDKLSDTDKVLLIVEDDPKFAKIVGDFAHRKGFKCLIAGDGETGLQLVKTRPPNGIILDLKLPRMSGWQVLETLKGNPDTRHIPVHIMSVDDETLDAFKKGAIGYLTKPVSQEDLESTFLKIELFISNEIKSLLLVEDDEKLRFSVKKLLGGSDIKITETSMGRTALELLRSQHFDCMILDLTLPDMSGFELLNKLNDDETIPKCPIIVYTGKALSEAETQELMKYADSVIVKGVKSPERLLDETALFLHRVVADMPEDKQRAIKQLYDKETQLSGKKILIVDDDARNSFALSKLLADKGLKVHIAQNGQKALEMLEKNEVDLVLMDIMMPVMDGYETIKRIRLQPKFRNLPILALTAKAMKGDREKCIAAGASDYLTKPIDPDRLFSMLRVWLYQ